jgi:Cof subfamily protein (haloacid dehalogenase superfamily)
MNQKLIILDIDGTIAEHDGFIHKETVDAINRVEDAGHHVMLASGRSIADIVPIVTSVDLNSEFIVATNGAVIFESKNGEYERIRALEINPDSHIEHFKAIAPEANFVLETLDDGYYYDKKFTLPFSENVTRNETHLGDLYGRSSVRLVIGEEGWNSDFWIDAIEAYGRGLLGVHKETNNMWVEILHDEADKSFAIEHVRSQLEIPMSEVIVMGDGHNDIKMFQWANNGGKSFVMGQAHPEVKKHAQFENLNVEHRGVAKTLNDIFGFSK